MAFKIFLFLLPTLVSAQIKIHIDAGRTLEDSFVQAIGSSIEVISDVERDTFQLQDWRIYNAVEGISGKRPNDVFVRSPTPWNDLYSTFNWQQVTRTLKPISATVLNLTKKPTIVARKFFRNHSHKNKAKYSGSISQQKDVTASTTWSNSFGLSIGHSIECSVGISDVLSAGATSSFSFSSEWGKETAESETTTLGSGLGVEVELQPGKKAMSVLSASLGTLEVEVEYEASLSGFVATNYYPQYQGHYFWGYSVESVLNAMGLPSKKTSKQIIKVGFYSEEQVTVHDLD